MQARWRKQQQHVLSALNIPVFTLRDRAALANSSQADYDGTNATPTPQFSYRLGPVYISASTPLPVEPPRWLADLCVLFDCTPVSVKAPTDEAMIIGIDHYLQHGLVEQDKRKLWQQLVYGQFTQG